MGRRRDYPILRDGTPRMAKIGQRLKQDLQESGVQYTALGRISGVDPQLIGRLCRNPQTVPDLKSLAAIAKARERSIDWYVWEHPTELSVVCSFLAFSWHKLLPEERETVLNVVKLTESALAQRSMSQKYKTPKG